MRLDVFLARQPEVGTRVRAKELIEQGYVSIQGQKAKPGAFLIEGLQVEFTVPKALVEPFGAGEPPPQLSVLYVDDYLVAIDKPAGLAAHPPEHKAFRGHTVASCAVAQFGPLPTLAGEDRPGIVHRLDRETSGVMVMARTEAAFVGLQNQFRERVAQKEYRAITFGEARFESDWIQRSIASDPKHPDRMTVVQEGGRESSTYYEVIERFRGFTYFCCKPRTGRTHQIRVHMTSIGHSLVSDKVYKSRKAQHDLLPAEAPDPQRHCLHAMRLSLLHPITQAELSFEAPMPADLERLLAWLRAERKVR